MKPWSAGFLSLLLSPGWALAAAPASGLGHTPTRLQLCQQEVQDAAGEQRKRMLRNCLVRRNEGEAGVAAQCRQQLRIGTGSKRTPAQTRQLRDCESGALAVPSHQLPRRPAPAPALLPSAPRPTPPAAAQPAPRQSSPYLLREGA